MTTYPPQNALSVVADATDLRDRCYQPALLPLKPELPRPISLHIVDQGYQGACTGFGVRVHMRYEMAKLYDKWPGEDYPASSCSGAIKGWNNGGVCQDDLAPFSPGDDKFRIIPEIPDFALQPLSGTFSHATRTTRDRSVTRKEILISKKVSEQIFAKPCGARGEERIVLHGLATDGLPWPLSATQEQFALRGGARAYREVLTACFAKICSLTNARINRTSFRSF